MSQTDRTSLPTGIGPRSGLGIAAAFFTASALGFILLGVLARWVTREQNAQFLALWGLVFGIGSALSAIEQEIVRLATNSHIDGTAVPARAIQVVGLAVLVAGAVLMAILMLPGVGELLRTSLIVCLLVFLATGGFAVQCLSRAVLLGTGQVGSYVTVVICEATFRLVLVLLFLFVGVSPTLAVTTLVIAIGCFGWIPVFHRVTSQLSWSGQRSSMRSVGSTVGALGLANGLQSLQVTAFTALAPAVMGTSAAIAPVLGAATMARLPLVALTPVQAMAVPIATRMVREGRERQLLVLVAKLSAGGAICSAIALVAGWLFGPWALRIYMGESYVIAPAVVATLLAAGCVLAVALLEAAAIIALERYWTAALVWAIGALSLTLTMAFTPGGPDVRVAAGVSVGAVVSWLLATVAVTREARRRHLNASCS